MIVDRNIIAYIHSLETDGPEWLEEIRRNAVKQQVPIIRQEMENFLRVLLRMVRPRKILEIGTGIGYSALFMESCLPGVHITTIENYEPRLREARRNLAQSAFVSLLEGDAVQILKTLETPADFIFLDAAKGQYLAMLPELLRLLNPGGVLLADNVLQDGTLVQSRYLTPRRQRTIHSRMREFIWEVTHHPELDASLIPIGDGIVLCRKQDQKDRRNTSEDE